MRGERPLSPEEAALWARVLETVRPIRVAKPVALSNSITSPAKPVPSRAEGAGAQLREAAGTVRHSVKAVPATGPRLSPGKEKRGNSRVASVSAPANTLDGSWDRQLARGIVSPDRTIDLHGHNLGSAYALLDTALARAISDGDRVVLLITGKPPRAASERPHARGAIRAAIGDWLAGSRHASAIAAVRGAHPRHGGTGALYIVLRRPRTGQKS